MAVVPDAMRFCFDVCTRGTTLEGAVVEIDVVAGRGTLSRVRRRWSEVATPLPLCGCGSADLALVGGDELRIREVEVANRQSGSGGGVNVRDMRMRSGGPRLTTTHARPRSPTSTVMTQAARS